MRFGPFFFTICSWLVATIIFKKVPSSEDHKWRKYNHHLDHTLCCITLQPTYSGVHISLLHTGRYFPEMEIPACHD
jgi:hypothetical protein